MFRSLTSLAKSWKRNKGFLSINIIGLTIGLAVSVLLLLLMIPLVIHTIVALLATFTISYRAATRNPVEALRYE